MVTMAVGKESQSTEKAQRRNHNFAEGGQKEISGGGAIWTEPQRISRLPAEGPPVEVSSSR